MESKRKPLESTFPTQPSGMRKVEHVHSEIQSVLEREEHLAIATRAHELFEARGSQGGHDREDWLRAESELHLQE